MSVGGLKKEEKFWRAVCLLKKKVVDVQILYHWIFGDSECSLGFCRVHEVGYASLNRTLWRYREGTRCNSI